MSENPLDQARKKLEQRDYNGCLSLLLPLLDRKADDEEATELVRTALYLGMDANNPSPLSPGLLSDPLLDPHLAECARCRRFWAVNPFLKDAASVTVFNPAGGRCPRCARCYCRGCAIGKGLLTCPDCGQALEALKTPTGRTRSMPSVPREARIPSSVLLFKEPPEPPVMRSYLQRVIEALCPEALRPGMDLYAETAGGPVDQTYALLRAMMIRPNCSSSQHEFVVQKFSDKDGGKGLLLKIYPKTPGQAR